MGALCLALWTYGVMNVHDYVLFEIQYESIRVAVHSPEDKVLVRYLLCRDVL
jgi:hypothetical protein